MVVGLRPGTPRLAAALRPSVAARTSALVRHREEDDVGRPSATVDQAREESGRDPARHRSNPRITGLCLTVSCQRQERFHLFRKAAQSWCDHVRCRSCQGREVRLLHDAVRVESLAGLSRFRTDFQDCLTPPCRRAVRPGRRGAVHRRAGAVADRSRPGAGASPGSRFPLRRAEPRRARCRPAAGSGRGAVAASGRRAAGPGRRRLTVAAAGRRHRAGPLVLPHLRPRRREASDDARLAVLGHRRAGDRPHLLVRPPWTRSVSPPGVDLAATTAAQVREVIDRLIAAGQSGEGDPDILIVPDAG